jgi:branched-chain amino acid transport system ATP-binding protein
MNMLEVQNLAVAYGQHRALKGVSLTVSPGEIVVILGANGAGKTSLLKAVAGLERGAGAVRLDGQTLAGLPPHRIVEAGLALVPEGRGIFGDLTVRENLLLGAFAHRARDGQSANLDRVLGLFPKLGERSGQMARTMSGGEQQMVAIGRALMSAPSILMLDEPSLGLSPLLCTDLFRNLRAIRDTGVGVLLVEQNARQSLAIADRAYLLENGEIVGQGPAAQLARDPAVQAAYLGGAVGQAATPATLSAAATPRPAAAIAARALDAVVRSGGYGTPTTSDAADRLLPTPIADLVRIATQRQDEAVTMQRHAPADAALAGRALAELKASGRLDDAVTRITQAAARSVPTAIPVPASAPAIEVWHRPGIEVWARQSDGTLKRTN